MHADHNDTCKIYVISNSPFTAMVCRKKNNRTFHSNIIFMQGIVGKFLGGNYIYM